MIHEFCAFMSTAHSYLVDGMCQEVRSTYLSSIYRVQFMFAWTRQPTVRKNFHSGTVRRCCTRLLFPDFLHDYLFLHLQLPSATRWRAFVGGFPVVCQSHLTPPKRKRNCAALVLEVPDTRASPSVSPLPNIYLFIIIFSSSLAGHPNHSSPAAKNGNNH
jgi:hypothetical protein